MFYWPIFYRSKSISSTSETGVVVSFVVRVISRILLGGYFVLNALLQLLHWDMGEKELFEGFTFWEAHLPKDGPFATVIVEIFQAPTVIIGLSFGVSMVLGAFLIFAIRPALCVFILGVTQLLSSTFFHPFWFFEGEKLSSELLIFSQHIAIIGGLLMHFSRSVQAPPTYTEDSGGYRMSYRDDE